ncbi:MAG: hypothetical protein KGH79_01945 [Patescibacteria group bacterium]|nr:hypothetical protein [Patescibacteria group bacterium]
MPPCIYCKTEDPEKFKGVEHVIPRSFGTFGAKTPTLKCVCDDCNVFFMKELDQVLARETLEGVTRYKKGIYSREARPQTKLKFSLAESPEVGDFHGAAVAVDGTTGKLMAPPAQYKILNKQTGKHETYRENQLKDLKITDEVYGKPGERETGIIAPSHDALDAFIKKLHEAGIPYKEKERYQPPFVKAMEGMPDDGVSTLEVTIDGKIDDTVKRALVKVLFNFAAYNLGAVEMLKSEWDMARNFIRFAGETLKGRVTQKPFWDGQETEKIRFLDDSYNLRIENQNGNVVGVLQFYNLFTYEFILLESYQIPPEQEVAYRFTPGQEPFIGRKMTMPQYLKMQRPE